MVVLSNCMYFLNKSWINAFYSRTPILFYSKVLKQSVVSSTQMSHPNNGRTQSIHLAQPSHLLALIPNETFLDNNNNTAEETDKAVHNWNRHIGINFCQCSVFCLRYGLLARAVQRLHQLRSTPKTNPGSL